MEFDFRNQEIENTAVNVIKNRILKASISDFLRLCDTILDSVWTGAHGLCSPEWLDCSTVKDDHFFFWLILKDQELDKEIHLNLDQIMSLYLHSFRFASRMKLCFSVIGSSTPAIFMDIAPDVSNGSIIIHPETPAMFNGIGLCVDMNDIKKLYPFVTNKLSDFVITILKVVANLQEFSPTLSANLKENSNESFTLFIIGFNEIPVVQLKELNDLKGKNAFTDNDDIGYYIETINIYWKKVDIEIAICIFPQKKRLIQELFSNQNKIEKRWNKKFKSDK